MKINPKNLLSENKRNLSFLTCIAFLSVMFLCASVSDSSSATTSNADKIIENIKTTQNFSLDKLPEKDIQRIVKAGINAPSSMNMQPWHFTIVTDADVLNQINDNMLLGNQTPNFANSNNSNKKAGIADAPCAIVISCETGSDLNAGIACQNMSAMAQIMGYGSKILTSTTIALNGPDKVNYYDILKIPKNMTIIAVLLIGKEDSSSVDSLSGASERNSWDKIVDWVK